MRARIDLSSDKWKVFDFTKTVRVNNKIKDPQKIAEHKLRVAFANARYRQKLSQNKLAQKSGICSVTIARMETGTCNLSLAKLVQLAEALDMELKLVPKKNSLKKRNQNNII